MLLLICHFVSLRRSRAAIDYYATFNTYIAAFFTLRHIYALRHAIRARHADFSVDTAADAA